MGPHSDQKAGHGAGPARTSWAEGWAFFDRVYCISLKAREDRRRTARDQFARVGLLDRVEFVLTDKPPNPEQGIYEAHLRCLRLGLESGARRILVFEDDVVFWRCTPARLARIVAFLEGCGDWDALFFGCMARRWRRLPGLPVAAIRYRNLTHAYAVSRAFAEELTQRHPWRGLAYDNFLQQLESPRMFAACPALAFQSSSPSDNDAWLHLDRMRRLLGGLFFLQWLDEIWGRFRWPIVALHVAALLAALLWLLQ